MKLIQEDAVSSSTDSSEVIVSESCAKPIAKNKTSQKLAAKWHLVDGKLVCKWLID
jgi:hypothetical protein